MCLHVYFSSSFRSNFCCYFQNVGLPKWSSTEIRNQDVHSNGPVLDDIILADPEVKIFDI